MNTWQKKYSSSVKKYAKNHKIKNYNKAKEEMDEICSAMEIKE